MMTMTMKPVGILINKNDVLRRMATLHRVRFLRDYIKISIDGTRDNFSLKQTQLGTNKGEKVKEIEG